MWVLHKPGDHKDSKLKKPKEEKVDLELQDDLCSLISVHAKDCKFLKYLLVSVSLIFGHISSQLVCTYYE